MPPQSVFKSCQAHQLRFERSIDCFKGQFASRSYDVPIISTYSTDNSVSPTEKY
jgi:hypothetical protein